jgi:hypothetical protein
MSSEVLDGRLSSSHPITDILTLTNVKMSLLGPYLRSFPHRWRHASLFIASNLVGLLCAAIIFVSSNIIFFKKIMPTGSSTPVSTPQTRQAEPAPHTHFYSSSMAFFLMVPIWSGCLPTLQFS